MNVYYLSFSKPEHLGGWIGFALIEAENEAHAVSKARDSDWYPSGQIYVLPVPRSDAITEEWMDKLFTTPEDVASFDAFMGGAGVAAKVTRTTEGDVIR
jgi:hypothetical protein